MPSLKPVASIAEFNSLDESDVLLGYLSGYEGEPEPGPDSSRGFVHGWRNGMLESGRRQPDEADRILATAFHAIA